MSSKMHEESLLAILAEADRHKRRKKVGRGRSSGHGRTCGRGREGQKARESLSNTHVRKQILKIRKAPRNISSNMILYPKFTITANMLDASLVAQMRAATNKQQAVEIFAASLNIPNDQHLTRNICDIFNIGFKYKRICFAGLGTNNLCIKISRPKKPERNVGETC
jgi:hypothetical protein